VLWADVVDSRSDVTRVGNFKDFEVTSVPHDGNCMFTAIALQIGRDKDDSREIRKEIVTFMTENPVFDAGIDVDSVVAECGSYDSYLKRMSVPGTWGDGLVLAAAVRLYKRPITVVPEGGRMFTIDAPNLPQSAVNMYLGFTGSAFSKTNNHYISLQPVQVAVSGEEPLPSASFVTASGSGATDTDRDHGCTSSGSYKAKLNGQELSRLEQTLSRKENLILHGLHQVVMAMVVLCAQYVQGFTQTDLFQEIVTDFLSTNLLATGRKVPVLSLKQRTIETRPVRHSQKSSNIDW